MSAVNVMGKENEMAFCRTEYCRRCDKEVMHTNGNCNECREEEWTEKIRAWESQSTNAKLTDLRERIEKLERGPGRY